MKLKHWLKEYRFKKATQRAMTPYQQQSVEGRRKWSEFWKTTAIVT